MVDEKLKELIEYRISSKCEFLGYGDLKNPIWFIGMEEGFDNSLKDWEGNLRKRFEATNNKETVDIQSEEMMNVPDHSIWFKGEGNKPNLQQTYRELIRILLICDPEGQVIEKIIEFP